MVSFNVCGIKNVLNYMPWCQNKTFEFMFESLDADVICLQETKIQAQDLTEEMVLVSGYDAYFTFPDSKRGYSGVAMYVKKGIRTLKAEEGLTGWLESKDYKGVTYRDLLPSQSIGGYPTSIDKNRGIKIDGEGRAIILELEAAVIIGLYCPASSTEEREEYRSSFFESLDLRVKNLIKYKPVVVMGDLNIARELIDSADGRQTLYREGRVVPAADGREFININRDIMEEWKKSTYSRTMLNSWVDDMGMVDCCRIKHPRRLGMYTCWNLKLGARAGNFGSRIDYIFSTRDLECTNSDILSHLLGSDHCPVFADFTITSLYENEDRISNPPRLSASYFGRFRNKRTIHSLFASSSEQKRSTTNVSSENTQKRPKIQTKPINGSGAQTDGVSSRKKGSSKQQKIYSFFEKPGPDPESKTREAPFGISPQVHGEKNIRSLSVMDPKDRSIPLQNNVDRWKHIFTPPPPPRCKVHNEPCKMMTTKKNGINRGRSFWVCSRYVSIRS
ncbi:hypothetical protein TRICI_000484 [Trichomonascus ciferrii]|uniref:DNA-(apurinic or apyrimidinic site) endonuclease n=1 Tax=Trichomonascus ciferrii TaxID=44093 RepID=A0A642VDB3_9ASCO|nr:hypothetical protein TRICI_000484 [Trichomonascus ciferrii]